MLTAITANAGIEKMKRSHQNYVQNFIGILPAITANAGIEKMKRRTFKILTGF